VEKRIQGMASAWLSFTNQKLYLAGLQFDQAVGATTVPARESAKQGGLMLLHAAWIGLLNEVAEAFGLKGAVVQSLPDLEKSLGSTISEVAALLALQSESHSWLSQLLRDYNQCMRPHVKTTAVPGGEINLIAVQDSDSGPQRYQLILQDAKDYMAAARDRMHEW
jgi:hypothetical protein